MESYHYIECGLDNIYLLNGFKFMETSRGRAVSIHDIDGLHRAIGLYLVTNQKDLSSQNVRFLRNEMLMSQYTLGQLLGVSEQAVHRWESDKTAIPKPSEYLLRLLYREYVNDRSKKIALALKEVAELEDRINDGPIHFSETGKGWISAA